jgi:hypothetical protein
LPSLHICYVYYKYDRWIFVQSVISECEESVLGELV